MLMLYSRSGEMFGICRDVFAEDVELDVDDCSGLDVFEIGVLLGIGNDTNGNKAFVALNIRFTNRQTHAVDGD